MNYFLLICGISSCVLAVALTIISIARTPDNLRGFYGLMYVLFAVALLAAGVIMILNAVVF